MRYEGNWYNQDQPVPGTKESRTAGSSVGFVVIGSEADWMAHRPDTVSSNNFVDGEPANGVSLGTPGWHSKMLASPPFSLRTQIAVST